ncbi:hypothetical protein HYDPIDRAFT_27409 [Hydnomerulius pinastri MD-312]|nr:hypothetical protein HYDPIDRAFT_27409 [Hydnomerulius pinastri MD-312]
MKVASRALSRSDVMAELALEDFWVSRVTAFNACSALMVLTWDWLCSLDDEIAFIWPHAQQPPNGRTVSFGTLNILFVQRMEKYTPFVVATCRLWLTYQGILVEAMMTGVEGLLMIRVYVLWNRSKRIFFMFGIFLVLEVSCMIVSASLISPNAVFNQICLFKKPPLLFVLFSVAALLTQFAIIAFTVYRHQRGPDHRMRRPTLATLTVREGCVVASTIFALFLVGVVYIFLDTEYGDIMFYWILSVLSISGCRLILSAHRFHAENSTALPSSYGGDENDVCLSTIIEPDPDEPFSC